MRPKSLVLIMIALGCGLVASIGISQVMENRAGQGQGEVVDMKEIFVAVADIPVGTALTPELVKLEKWPSDRVPQGWINKIEDIQGKMPKSPLYSGEPIMTAKLSDSLGGTGERIPKGYRVMSVKVSTDTGVSGLILPGDRVDVLVFLKQSGEIVRTGTRTILRDVCIFAVDGKINRETDPDGGVVNVKTVSVLVKPDQVERLMLANQLGRLSLSLRRADDIDTDAETSGADVASLNDSITSNQGGTDGLLSFIDKIRDKPSQTSDNLGEVAANTAAAFTMEIHTPDGVEVVSWDDKNSLPRGKTAADTGNPMPPLNGATKSDPLADDLEPETTQPKPESDGVSSDGPAGPTQDPLADVPKDEPVADGAGDDKDS
ncbi:MAG: Flp pilus assembly protein CpaB [Planctomycetota bacterium]|nr:Flp pilus assembly protein CpaB [Planctomycetota bacterium]MDA1179122.1 Flp pilus assembly protein CpaB [Planctomycetota bacterium]